MLIPKPYIEIKHMKKMKKQNPLNTHEELDEEKSLREKLNPSDKTSTNQQISEDLSEKEQPEEESSEIIVHQLIETI